MNVNIQTLVAFFMARFCKQVGSSYILQKESKSEEPGRSFPFKAKLAFGSCLMAAVPCIASFEGLIGHVHCRTGVQLCIMQLHLDKRTWSRFSRPLDVM